MWDGWGGGGEEELEETETEGRVGVWYGCIKLYVSIICLNKHGSHGKHYGNTGKLLLDIIMVSLLVN